MAAVKAEDLGAGTDRLGLAGKPLGVHVSLRSFGSIHGGVQTLIDALLAKGTTLLVATMANSAYSIPAPPDDRPSRNGIDYDHKDRLAAADPWPGQSGIYDASRTETDPWLGVTSEYVAAHEDRVRCQRPYGEFCALGPLAERLISAEVADDVFGPLRELVRLDGWIVLMGTTLTSMTLLHLAEAEAERRPFIRWARGRDGQPVRVVGGECSKGFDNLSDVLAPIERRTTVGTSVWRAFPAREVMQLAVDEIRRRPDVTRCADAACIECPDAIAGGPII